MVIEPYSIMLDLIHDIVESDAEPKSVKINKILKAVEANDRLGDAFGEFLSWFKLEDTDAS